MKKRISILAAIVLSISTVTGCTEIPALENSLGLNSNTESTESDADSSDADSSDYILPSDTQTITEIDLSKLNETELRYAYAEVFARHGKEFDNQNWVKYFGSKSWYVPDPSYSDSMLTDLEKENANFIKEYINTNYETTTQATTQAPAATQPEVVYVPQPTAPQKTYTSYDSSYIIPDSSTRKLTRSELSGYSSSTLALIRNEIYARNGYIFQKEYYRNYFNSKSWYHPNSNFNESWLNSTEKYNISLIKSME